MKTCQFGRNYREANKRKTQIIANLKEKAAILSGLRKKVATTFEQRVLSELAELSMKNSSFKIDFVFWK